MSQIGLVEIFNMGEADGINRYAVCYPVFLGNLGSRKRLS